MTRRITAPVVTFAVDPELGSAFAGLSEEDGEFVLVFLSGIGEPDQQEIATGMDTYCVVTAEEGTCYGGVTAVSLDGGVLRVTFAETAVRPLGLADTDLEIVLDADSVAIERFRAGLARILAYGRPEAHPVLSGL
ncbi:Imm10 family immunity protein [Amycolatopsis sp. NPDC004378]